MHATHRLHRGHTHANALVYARVLTGAEFRSQIELEIRRQLGQHLNKVTPKQGT